MQGIEAGGLHSTSHLAGADFDSGPTHSAVLTGSSDGSVRLFDLRAAHHTGPDLQFQSHDGPLTGLALRRSGILASASQGAAYSEIHFADLRMASQGPTTCVPGRAASRPLCTACTVLCLHAAIMHPAW